MGFVGGHSQDEPSTRVILFDEPGLRNRQAKSMQFGGGATAGHVRDT